MRYFTSSYPDLVFSNEASVLAFITQIALSNSCIEREDIQVCVAHYNLCIGLVSSLTIVQLEVPQCLAQGHLLILHFFTQTRKHAHRSSVVYILPHKQTAADKHIHTHSHSRDQHKNHSFLLKKRKNIQILHVAQWMYVLLLTETARQVKMYRNH